MNLQLNLSLSFHLKVFGPVELACHVPSFVQCWAYSNPVSHSHVVDGGHHEGHVRHMFTGLFSHSLSVNRSYWSGQLGTLNLLKMYSSGVLKWG